MDCSIGNHRVRGVAGYNRIPDAFGQTDRIPPEPAGRREDALLLATLMVREDAAPQAIANAQRRGVALTCMDLGNADSVVAEHRNCNPETGRRTADLPVPFIRTPHHRRLGRPASENGFPQANHPPAERKDAGNSSTGPGKAGSSEISCPNSNAFKDLLSEVELGARSAHRCCLSTAYSELDRHLWSIGCRKAKFAGITE